MFFQRFAVSIFLQTTQDKRTQLPGTRSCWTRDGWQHGVNVARRCLGVVYNLAREARFVGLLSMYIRPQTASIIMYLVADLPVHGRARTNVSFWRAFLKSWEFVRFGTLSSFVNV